MENELRPASICRPGFFLEGHMKLTNRLLTCANLVRCGNVAADIGTDHGYLPIYLLEQGICPRVLAADIREMPLEAAKRSVRRAGITEHIDFYLSDGLEALPVEKVQTVICAGMGGDCIIGILDRTRTVWQPDYQFVLQPQSSVSDLRCWLSEQHFTIQRERLARDGKFIYTVMDVIYGGTMNLTPGEHFLPIDRFDCSDPLLLDYYNRSVESLTMTVQGLSQAKQASVAQKNYYETALEQVQRMGENYGFGQ